MEYAIVDIETTGGDASGSGITEIAILIHDGKSVLDRYETLIHPGRSIPLYITTLTGIDNDLVGDSPRFGEVAEKIFSLLEGRVFVAHNVNFDYTFVKHHLALAGHDFSAPKLCTVRMSRKIKPGLKSYSLGNLCDTLKIPIEKRHRAGGDADATAILFSRLMEWDTENHIPAMLKRGSKEQQLPPNLPREEVEALPRCPGVYYFKDRTGKIIYVGKAKDLRKRVTSHFTGHNIKPQRQHFLRSIFSVCFEICATELMAFLLEAVEIKRLWPAYNRALKKYDPKFGLFAYEDQNSYLRLAIGRFTTSHLPVQVFSNYTDATNHLQRLAREFGLCPELCRIGKCGTCSARETNDLSCPATRPAAAYNLQVKAALAQLQNNQPSFTIMDVGRDEEEQSCIWVEKGNFYGMGYIPKHTDLQSPEDIKSILSRYPGNHYMMQLIHTHVAKYPHKAVDLSRLLPCL